MSFTFVKFAWYVNEHLRKLPPSHSQVLQEFSGALLYYSEHFSKTPNLLKAEGQYLKQDTDRFEV